LVSAKAIPSRMGEPRKGQSKLKGTKQQIKYFAVFRPKNTCQAQKQHNPLQINNIQVAYQLPSTRYNKYIDQKTKEAPGKPPGLTY
jgi:hypothetical protein